MKRLLLTVPAAILLAFSLIVSWGVAGEREQDLLEAAGEGDLTRVESLLRKGADVNARSRDGQTPLIKASSNGNEKIVEKLLTAGAHVHLTTKDGKTALIEACRAGQVDVARYLLEKGANIHAKDTSPKNMFWPAPELCTIG